MLFGDNLKPPGAVVLGCSGTFLTSNEIDLFKDVQPAGFILFSRNIENSAQVIDLVEQIRSTSNMDNPFIMIDQEGGRVQRLGPPNWPSFPPLRSFGERGAEDPEEAAICIELNYRLIAIELMALGINVNCAPVLDLFYPSGNKVIGDRAISGDADLISTLGQSVCKGLLAHGVMPVMKHIPGHGRATSDSHVDLPIVDTELEVLKVTDFLPFRTLNFNPAAMTAHVVYNAIDPQNAGSVSENVVHGFIRGDIGFEGLLFSDDVCMGALSGNVSERIYAVLNAGCDIALHCSGDYTDMAKIAEKCPAMKPKSIVRMKKARAMCCDQKSLDMDAARFRVARFIGT